MSKSQKHLLGKATLLLLCGICSWQSSAAMSEPAWEELGPAKLDQVVGQISGHCCRFGQRWGCDPINFRQSGCVPVDVIPLCQKRAKKVMSCTASYCRTTSAEDTCTLITRNVAHNVCRPEGRLTTVGCPVDEYQCKITIFRYTDPTAPISVRSVCAKSSTLCPFKFSRCL